MMKTLKRPILDRYHQTPEGRIIIDITAAKIEELFNDFDKATPYAKKDLEKDFYNYLIDCVVEIHKAPFLIRINLDAAPDPTRWQNATEGIRNFFVYMRVLKIREIKNLLRTSFILLGLGVVVMILSLWTQRLFANDSGVFGYLFTEGLTVAAWVLLWESLANFLIQWPPHHKQIRQYDRITEAEIISHYPDTN